MTAPPDLFPALLGVLLAAAGPGTLVAAPFAVARMRRITGRTGHATGTVLAAEPDVLVTGRPVATVTFTYSDAEGGGHQVEQPGCPPVDAGDTVPVYYRPARPAGGRTPYHPHYVWQTALTLAAVGLIGTVLLVATLSFWVGR